MEWVNPFKDAKIHYFSTTSSTMDEARRYISAQKSIFDGTVFIAGYQTSGRGRFPDRVWISEKNKDLLFTVVFRKETLRFPFMRLPVTSGLLVARTLEKLFKLKIALKWPNDIIFVDMENGFVKPKKLGGILCEADNKNILVGIGLNCNGNLKKNKVIESSAISLKEITGKEVELPRLLYGILLKFKDYLSLHIGLEDLEEWKSSVNERLLFNGEVKKVKLGIHTINDDIIEGKIIGIGNEGQLLVEKKNGERTEIFSGEVI